MNEQVEGDGHEACAYPFWLLADMNAGASWVGSLSIITRASMFAFAVSNRSARVTLKSPEIPAFVVTMEASSASMNCVESNVRYHRKDGSRKVRTPPAIRAFWEYSEIEPNLTR